MARALAIDKDGKLCFERGSQKYGAQPMQLCAACSMSWPADGTRSHCFSERTGPAAILRFDSTREMNRYLELAFAQKAGAISELKTQPRFKMPPGFAYVADFEYVEDGRRIIED